MTVTELTDIKERLCADALAAVMHLYPQGRQQGHLCVLGDIAGGPGSSLKIHVEGDMVGIFKDHASGEAGDNLVELWRQAKNLPDAWAAAKEAAEWLGVIVSEQPLKRNLSQPGRVPVKYEPVTEKWGTLTEKSLSYLVDKRQISELTLQLFDIGSEIRWFGEVQAEKPALVFPYVNEVGECEMLKYIGYRSQDGVLKKMVCSNKGARKVLFGKKQVPKTMKTLTIVEGEIDAMTLKEHDICAVSVPFGAKSNSMSGSNPNDEWIANDYDWLEQFDKIVLAFDNDEPGQSAMRDLLDRLGRHRCVTAKPPEGYNDWNEAHVAGEDLLKSWIVQESYDPTELRAASDYTDTLLELFYPTDNSLKGYFNPLAPELPVRPGEVTLWTGINGHGKSLVLLELMNIVAVQGARVCIASLEIPPEKSLARMAQQCGGVTVPSPDNLRSMSESEFKELWFYDKVGNANIDDILSTFEYAHRRYGVDQFVLDSLMKLGISFDDFNGQKIVMEKLCNFVEKYKKTHIHIVAHAKKPKDESQVADKTAVAGHADLTNLAWNVVSVWRNKAKEAQVFECTDGEYDEIMRASDIREIPDACLDVVKNREGGVEPTYKLRFNRRNQTYLPMRCPVNGCFTVDIAKELFLGVSEASKIPAGFR